MNDKLRAQLALAERIYGLLLRMPEGMDRWDIANALNESADDVQSVKKKVAHLAEQNGKYLIDAVPANDFNWKLASSGEDVIDPIMHRSLQRRGLERRTDKDIDFANQHYGDLDDNSARVVEALTKTRDATKLMEEANTALMRVIVAQRREDRHGEGDAA